jgi:hypothetical protein
VLGDTPRSFSRCSRNSATSGASAAAAPVAPPSASLTRPSRRRCGEGAGRRARRRVERRLAEHAVAPLGEVAEGALGELLALGDLVAHRLREVVDEAEVGVHRLEVPRVGLAQVAVEGAQHRRRRRQRRLPAAEHARQVHRREDPRRRALGVPLDPSQLAGDERRRRVAEREVRQERGRRVHVRVAVDAAEAQELRVREPRDHPEDALLLGVAEPGLEADHVPHPPGAVLHAQLHHRPRPPPGARVDEPHRLERPEAERVAPAPRHLLDRHAPLEVRHLVEGVRRRPVGGHERVEERLVLLAGHRAVEVRALPAGPLHRFAPPPRRPERHRRVDRVGGEHRRDGVVEGERGGPEPGA